MKIKALKPIFAFLILIVLTLVLSAVLLYTSFYAAEQREKVRNGLKKEGTISTLRSIEKDINQYLDTVRDKIFENLDIMAAALGRYFTEDGYEGPRIFEDGVVVERDGEFIRFPEDFGKYFMEYGDKFRDEEMLLEPFQMTEDGDESELVYLSTKRITDDIWYYDWLTKEEYHEYETDMGKMFDTISELEKSYNAYLLVVQANDPDLSLFYYSDDFGELSSAKDFGFTEENIREEVSEIVINGKNYSCSYTRLRLFGESFIAILMVNSESEYNYAVNYVLFIGGLILVIMTGVILWLYWTQSFVRDHGVTDEQKKAYHPVQIRKISFSVGLVSMIVIVIASLTWQSLTSLYKEAADNRESLYIMFDLAERNDQTDSIYRENEESWNLYHAQRIAEMISADPALGDQDFLAEVNEILGSQYIMLFDSTGKETVASNGFIGMELGPEISESASDFKRILHGVDYIIHEPEDDLVVNSLTQLTAVRLENAEDQSFGVLLIADNPLETWMKAEMNNFHSFMKMITPSGNLSLIVENETDRVSFSSDLDLVGETGHDLGLTKDTLTESALDTFHIDDKLWYGPFEKDDNWTYYYLTDSEYLQGNKIAVALISAAGFLIIDILISLFMLVGYRSKAYNEMVQLQKSDLDSTLLDGTVNNEWLRLQYDDDDDEREDLKLIWWKLPPERKIAIFSQFFLSLIMLFLLFKALDPTSAGARSALGFILRGTWKRGINLLAFAGIVFVVTCFVLFLMLKSLLISVLGVILDRKGETVLRLTLSLIQYAGVIGVLYFVFNYLGFDSRALLASVSFLSLAVTLGSKDLVADILAGIFIIFEDDFNVGDIIEVNGFSGIVQEIGVRSTKLIGIGDNVKIIGNQSVKGVLNMSKMNSWYSLELKIPAVHPMAEVEAVLNEALPGIGESIPEIISGPFYKGVMSIGLNNTYYIIAECRQPLYRIVQRKLNHAIRELCDQHQFMIN